MLSYGWNGPGVSNIPVALFIYPYKLLDWIGLKTRNGLIQYHIFVLKKFACKFLFLFFRIQLILFLIVLNLIKSIYLMGPFFGLFQGLLLIHRIVRD